MNTRRFAVITTVAMTGMASLSACGSWYQRPAETAAQPCTGHPYLEVRNSFETPLDIYGYVRGESNARYLGTVSPGSQRISLEGPVGRVFAQVGGKRVMSRETRNGNPSSMLITRGCDAATD